MHETKRSCLFVYCHKLISLILSSKEQPYYGVTNLIDSFLWRLHRDPANQVLTGFVPIILECCRSPTLVRFQSTAPTSTTFLHKAKKETVKKNWLSDSSVYPLMLVMASAASLVVGVGVSCLLYNPEWVNIQYLNLYNPFCFNISYLTLSKFFSDF